MNAQIKKIPHFVMIYAGALLCGAIGYLVYLPLPWMIGAIGFATTLRLMEKPVHVMPMSRPAGQMIVAASVGLSFTPAAVAAVTAMFVPMISAAVLTIFASLLVAAILVRMTQVDVVTATLSAIPIGPVESANLAVKHGVFAGPIIFTQTMRILLLVIFIPPILVYFSDMTERPSDVLMAAHWSVEGALLLGGIGIVGGVCATFLKLGNPYFIGALAGTALASALSLPLTAFPYPVIVLAQIFLGVWLGAVFDRQLLRNASGFIMGAMICTLLLIVICASIGLGLARLTAEPWQAMILATAPGSVTEMALTAKVLQEGIAMVTAFHVVRIFIILPLAPLIISLTARVSRAWGLR